MLFRIHTPVVLVATILVCMTVSQQPVLASPLTAKSLEENRLACMTACSKKSGGDARCTAYCECGTKALASQMTEEEYQAGVSAIANNQLPADDSMRKTLAIAHSCAATFE